LSVYAFSNLPRGQTEELISLLLERLVNELEFDPVRRVSAEIYGKLPIECSLPRLRSMFMDLMQFANSQYSHEIGMSVYPMNSYMDSHVKRYLQDMQCV